MTGPEVRSDGQPDAEVQHGWPAGARQTQRKTPFRVRDGAAGLAFYAHTYLLQRLAGSVAHGTAKRDSLGSRCLRARGHGRAGKENAEA